MHLGGIASPSCKAVGAVPAHAMSVEHSHDTGNIKHPHTIVWGLVQARLSLGTAGAPTRAQYAPVVTSEKFAGGNSSTTSSSSIISPI